MIMQPTYNFGTRVYFVNGVERLPYYSGIVCSKPQMMRGKIIYRVIIDIQGEGIVEADESLVIEVESHYLKASPDSGQSI